MIDFPASPSAGQIFSAAGASWRYDGTKWVAYGASSSNAGRNLIHNSMFNIAQRGVGTFTGTGTTAYTLDRWSLTTGGGFDAITQTQTAASDADRTGIGDEAARFTLNNVFTGSANAGASSYIEQRLESVRRLSGKTVTISFWAVGSVALNFGINAFQIFGTGGSPSAFVQVLTTGMAVSVTTAWARYSVTFAVPSTAGKTFGTNNDDSTWLRFYFSSGATSAAAAGNIGVQSGTLRLWGVQFEIGSVATPLEKPDPQQDMAKCQRFYENSFSPGTTGSPNLFAISGLTVAANFVSSSVQFAVAKRASPTITFYSPVTGASGKARDYQGGADVNASLVLAASNGMTWSATGATSGTINMAANWTASADL